MANFLRLSSMRFPVLLKTFVRPKVSLPRLKPLKFDILGERHGCAQVVRRDARYLSSTSDANNGANKSSSDEKAEKGNGENEENEEKPNRVIGNKIRSISSNYCEDLDDKTQKWLYASADLFNLLVMGSSSKSPLFGSHMLFHKVHEECSYYVFSLMSRQRDALLRVERSSQIAFNGTYDKTHPAALMVPTEERRQLNKVLYELRIEDGSTHYILGWNIRDEPVLFPAGGNENFFFELEYGWSYTMIKQSRGKEDLRKKSKFLASNPDGEVKFVEIENFAYPNAQALFVIHEASIKEESDIDSDSDSK